MRRCQDVTEEKGNYLLLGTVTVKYYRLWYTDQRNVTVVSHCSLCIKCCEQNLLSVVKMTANTTIACCNVVWMIADLHSEKGPAVSHTDFRLQVKGGEQRSRIFQSKVNQCLEIQNELATLMQIWPTLLLCLNAPCFWWWLLARSWLSYYLKSKSEHKEKEGIFLWQEERKYLVSGMKKNQESDVCRSYGEAQAYICPVIFLKTQVNLLCL